MIARLSEQRNLYKGSPPRPWGGWLHVDIPEVRLNQDIVGYGNDAVVSAAKASSPDFGGLADLPLLRMMEYGGDADWFWIRPLQRQP
jgi:hypothetical protein